jgi:long-subunit acyl-CoA synthetase (AMP-forming)
MYVVIGALNAAAPEVHLCSDDQLLTATQAEAVYHVTANNKVLRRTYSGLADRARGLAYYLKKHGFKRVGILCPNTPAFLESIFGIAAAGAVNVGKEICIDAPIEQILTGLRRQLSTIVSRKKISPTFSSMEMLT